MKIKLLVISLFFYINFYVVSSTAQVVQRTTLNGNTISSVNLPLEITGVSNTTQTIQIPATLVVNQDTIQSLTLNVTNVKANVNLPFVKTNITQVVATNYITNINYVTNTRYITNIIYVTNNPIVPPITNNPIVPPITNTPLGSITFPIEVIGPDQTQEQVQIVLVDNPKDAYGIKFKMHALTFTNKASVSINGSTWIPVNNKTVIIPKLWDRVASGIAGIHATIDFVIPSQNNYTLSSTNIIKFKFNDIDNSTVGYRVLDIQIVKATDGGTELIYNNKTGGILTKKVLKFIPLQLNTQFTQEDPSSWKPISTDPIVINQGKDLWYNGNITEHGLPIKAKCTDCHASNGEDVKYFNYSDRAIIARSIYHGLNSQQGSAIASFIRSLNVPYQPNGRPWNPPYQPGPGLDSKPVSSWAAGAGIDWVLTDDSDSMKYIFPNGILNGIQYNGSIQTIDFKKTLNLREIPIVMQMPDWNHWLPKSHLKDTDPDIYATDSAKQFYGFYDIVYNYGIKNSDLDTLKLLEGQKSLYYGLYFNQIYDALDKKYTTDEGKYKFHNIAVPALRRYQVVKNWDLVMKFGLQGLGHKIFDRPDVYTSATWLSTNELAYINIKTGNNYKQAFNERRWYDGAIFRVGPHIGKEWQYTTNYAFWVNSSAQWYQLQMILNDDGRNPTKFSVDWGYLHALLQEAGLQWTFPAENPSLANRKYLTLTLMNQIKAAETQEFRVPKADSDGFMVTRVDNFKLFYNAGNWWEIFNHYQSDNTGIDINALRDIAKTFGATYINKVNSFTPDQIKAGHETYNVYDRSVDLENAYRYIGVDKNAINQLVDWRDKVWPDKPYKSYVTVVYPTPQPAPPK